MIAKDISSLVGKTPLVKLNRVTQGCKAEVIAKLESFNPGHSLKDRVALSIILDAEKKGLIKSDTIIIEPTSGNTAISLAAICASKGYPLILVIPESTSVERIKILKGFGSKIVLTPKREGMIGAFKKVSEITSGEPEKYFVAGQFKNFANPRAHERTTARELWKDTSGKIDLLVSGVGTGGTITGCARYLKKKKENLKIIAVEPANSPILSGGKPGPHSIPGIGAGFIPSLYDAKLVDEIITVTDEAAFEMTRRLAKEEGILAGISSGAACWSAIQVANRPENEGKMIVVIFPDTGERYLNTFGLFDV